MFSKVRICADAIVLAGFSIASYVCLQSIDSPTYWFPTFVTTSGALSAGYLLVSDGMRLRAGKSLVSGEVTDIGASVSDIRVEGEGGSSGEERVRRRVVAWSLWLVALPLLGLFIPFFYASLTWLAAVLLLQAKRNWKHVAPAILTFGVFLNLIVVLLDIDLPPAFLSGLG